MHDYNEKVIPAVYQTQQILQADLTHCKKKLQTCQNNQFWRRMYVRALFALIEGMTHGIRSLAFSQHSTIEVVSALYGREFTGFQKLGQVWLNLMNDEAPEIKDNGEVKYKSVKTSVIALPLFVLRTCAVMIKYEPNLDLSDKGYQGLKIAVKVRDRLMHPKLSVDVSDQEMEAIEEGETWFLIKYQDLRGAQANFDERLKAWMLELVEDYKQSTK